MLVTIQTNTEEIEIKRNWLHELLHKLIKEDGVEVIVQNETNNRCMLFIDKEGLISERE